MLNRSSTLKKQLLVTFALLSGFTQANGADKSSSESQRTSGVSVKVIPSGTRIVCVLHTPIDGTTAKPGDKIALAIVRLVPDDDSAILRGCTINGEILQETDLDRGRTISF